MVSLRTSKAVFGVEALDIEDEGEDEDEEEGAWELRRLRVGTNMGGVSDEGGFVGDAMIGVTESSERPEAIEYYSSILSCNNENKIKSVLLPGNVNILMTGVGRFSVATALLYWPKNVCAAVGSVRGVNEVPDELLAREICGIVKGGKLLLLLLLLPAGFEFMTADRRSGEGLGATVAAAAAALGEDGSISEMSTGGE